MNNNSLEASRDSHYSLDYGTGLYTPKDQALEIVRAGVTPANDNWGEPSPLSSSKPAVLSLTEPMLPEAIRPFVSDVANRMQVPLDMPGVATVCATAGATGRRVKVQPKQRDTGWTKTPNLWCGIIAPPGSKKTPVTDACFQPLYTIQELLQAQEQNAEGGEGTDSAPMTRIIANDATQEILHRMMADNPHGLILIRDELTGLLETQNKPGREGERQFFLESWNGNSSYTMDRIGRGSIRAKCCLSIFGGIQPDKLTGYLRKWFLGGSGNDGFLERFQLLIWPDLPTHSEYRDEPPNTASQEQMVRIFTSIVGLLPEHQTVFRFDPSAQEYFVHWFTSLERRLLRNDLHPVLCSHLSKFRSLMPSLACLFALADQAARGFQGFDGSGGPLIALPYAQQAGQWCTYLESHARRIYAPIITPGLQPAEILAQHILGRKLRDKSSFTANDIRQKDWGGLKNEEAIETALALLVEKQWIRPVTEDMSFVGGRPTKRYEINPNIWERFKPVN